MSKYKYDLKNGGLLIFGGVQINGKEISAITADFSDNDTHLAVAAEYADGNSEEIEFDIADTASGGINITEISEKWNGTEV